MTIEFFVRPENTTLLVKSNIHPFTFHGGEWDLKVEWDNPLPGVQVAYMRGADANDIVVLNLWADLCRTFGFPTVLFLPYVPAARADRGVPTGLLTYHRLISQANVDRIIAIDPHSEATTEVYGDKLTVVPVHSYIPNTVGKNVYSGVIAPDKGATERARLAALKLDVPVYTATKERDFETGALSNFAAPENWDSVKDHGRYLIVDDICDGGGTFVGLAEVLGIPRERLDLWVTHGIFSKGLDVLSDTFGIIYTTDSHPAVDKFNQTSYFKKRELLPILNREAFTFGDNNE